MRQARPDADLNNLFGDAAVFRRLRSWSDLRTNRPNDADVWVFENWLNLPRMQRFRQCLVSIQPQQAVQALLDMIRLAATSDPPGHLSGSMLTLRGRVLDDHGIPSGLLLGAMLTVGLVRYVGNGFVKFSAPEMLTFPEAITDCPTDLEQLAETVASGPYMASHAVACRAAQPRPREPAAPTLPITSRPQPQREPRTAVG